MLCEAQHLRANHQQPPPGLNAQASQATGPVLLLSVSTARDQPEGVWYTPTGGPPGRDSLR